jgi:hypothetical protein
MDALQEIKKYLSQSFPGLYPVGMPVAYPDIVWQDSSHCLVVIDKRELALFQWAIIESKQKLHMDLMCKWAIIPGKDDSLSSPKFRYGSYVYQAIISHQGTSYDCDLMTVDRL